MERLLLGSFIGLQKKYNRKVIIKMDKTLEKLDYKGIFRYFSEISMIPRGSGNEQAVSDYLVSYAKEHKLEYTQDTAYNVIMIKEATPGYEEEPAIILQGHMDMVCEKRKDYTHDFLKDGIKLVVDGDFLCADGTTLGGDNGVAVAYILAMLSDESLEHPRLEAIITTDEEMGLNGAKALELSKLKGKYLINLDSEEEDCVLTSCAGGMRCNCILPIQRVEAKGMRMRLSLGGMQGGHSGTDIIKNRANAPKLLGRLLFELREMNNFALIRMQGGFKDNVIPREAEAEILIEGDIKEEMIKIKDSIAKLMNGYQQELSASEPDLDYELEELGEDTFQVLHPVSFEKMLFMLVNMPNGVQVMSSHIPGLVESSLNLGIFNTEEDHVLFTDAIRSSLYNYKHYMSNQLNYMINFLGGEFNEYAEYPGWEYKPDSLLREHYKRLYTQSTGKEMRVEAIHAGLECGIISEKLPGIDAISIGPDMFNVHTIEEKLNIPSAIRVYKLLEKTVCEKIRA
jgi:dipeptidase D